MKRETFIKIGKKCGKGECHPMCPHRGNGNCKNMLIQDAVKLIASNMAEDARKQDK